MLSGIAAISPWQSAQEIMFRVIYSSFGEKLYRGFHLKKSNLLISTVDFLFFIFLFFA